MYAVEFKAKIKDGLIMIPHRFRDCVKENVKVIILSEDKAVKSHDIIGKLLESPLEIADYTPLAREEIYER